ncbi:barstar family protein [Streptomyces sp. NPDC093225]|uniref:barstar family protein n=1 Tax=Streptomyces sp. NPDC093225 TaxID=3366034 RepID=UPI00381743CC
MRTQDPSAGDGPGGVREAVAGEPLGPVLDAAREAGWRTYAVELDGVRAKAALMEAFARGLRLPSWFGGNWDALADCLTDLSWEAEAEAPGPAGRLLVVGSWTAYAAARADEAEVLRDVLESAAGFWRETGPPLAVLLAPEAV